ncbi:MAG: response regulator [Candidatus Omnitrophica bacterium]|nr:response regulator [Candidatus Omnitrophota bacterium]
MKKRIMIIDDEERIRRVYGRLLHMLASNVFDIIQASDAAEATQFLIRDKVDVILLDLRMPRVNGQMMYDVIREYDREVPVIVISVYPIEQQRKMLPTASDYYDKSHGPIQLLEKIMSAAGIG